MSRMGKLVGYWGCSPKAGGRSEGQFQGRFCIVLEASAFLSRDCVEVLVGCFFASAVEGHPRRKRLAQNGVW